MWVRNSNAGEQQTDRGPQTWFPRPGQCLTKSEGASVAEAPCVMVHSQLHVLASPAWSRDHATEFCQWNVCF